jgi:transposase
MEQASIRLQLTATAPTVACPRCAMSSSSVHSRYQRRLTDLPWGTHAVRLQLTVRKFFCRNPTCARRIFTERLPDFAATSARKTVRLVTALQWSVRESCPRIWTVYGSWPGLVRPFPCPSLGYTLWRILSKH